MLETDWIDISVPLQRGLVHWPGDPGFEITRVQDMDAGATCNVSHLSLGAHSGTHMDAPLHFLADGRTIDQIPLEAVIGPARVIEIQDPVAIGPDELAAHHMTAGERILFKTRNSPAAWQSPTFVEDFVFISAAGADYLAEHRVQTVGVDYLSVGGFRRDGVETHQALLKAGIWIIEGLNLTDVQAGGYDLICLPLRITGAEAAPARALLRRRAPWAHQ
jgi:arylformamidase